MPSKWKNMFKFITHGLQPVFINTNLCEKVFLKMKCVKTFLQISFTRWIFAVDFGDRKY